MLPRSGYWIAGLLAIAIFAFWPSYFAKLPAGPTIYMHFHAVVMLAWMVLLVVQPTLIRTRRRELHRRLGRTSYVLAPTAVASAVLLSHSRFAPMSAAEFAGAAAFLYLPFAAAVLFAICYALAIKWRREPLLHSRWMIGTALTLIDPIVARILGLRLAPLADERLYPLIGYGLALLILVVLSVADHRAGRARAVFPGMLVLFGIVYAGFFVLAPTELWARLAALFRSLPLT